MAIFNKLNEYDVVPGLVKHQVLPTKREIDESDFGKIPVYVGWFERNLKWPPLTEAKPTGAKPAPPPERPNTKGKAGYSLQPYKADPRLAYDDSIPRQVYEGMQHPEAYKLLLDAARKMWPVYEAASLTEYRAKHGNYGFAHATADGIQLGLPSDELLAHETAHKLLEVLMPCSEQARREELVEPYAWSIGQQLKELARELAA